MWIELHESARQHPKVLRLSRDMDVTWPTAFGYVCALWTWTLTMAQDGDLSSFEPEDIEFGCGWNGEPGKLFDAFVKRRLIDLDGTSITVHDWWDFAGSIAVAKRKQKQRAKNKTGVVTGQSQDSRGTVTGQSRGPTDRPTDLTDRPQFQNTPPPPPQKTEAQNIPTEAENQFQELREYHAKIHSLEVRGFPRLDDTFWRFVAILSDGKGYSLKGCKRIVLGHKRQNKDATFSGLRFALKAVKDKPRIPDWEWLATYHKAGGTANVPMARNMDSSPEEQAAKLQAEAEEEHQRYCAEHGVDPDDKQAIRDLAKKAAKGGRDGSGPGKVF